MLYRNNSDMGDTLLFHPPSTRYTSQSLQGKIIWIPKQVPKKKKQPKKKSKSFDLKDRLHVKAVNCTGIKLLCTNSKRSVRENSSHDDHNEIIATAPEEKKSNLDTRPRKETYPGAHYHRKKSGDGGKKNVNSELKLRKSITEGENKIDLETKEPHEKAVNIMPDAKVKQSTQKDEERKKVKVKGGCFPFFHTPKSKLSVQGSCRSGVGPITLEKIEVLESQVVKDLEHEHESSSDSEEELDLLSFEITYIPCLFLPSKFPTKKILMYFHGNNEDISLTYDFLERLQSTFMINVLAVEYPGYGIYKGKTSGRKLLADANIVYNYLIGALKVEEKDIILFGRSIGTGAACQLASTHNPALLILLSPFASIRAVAKDHVGLVGQYLIKERFKNLQLISQVTCPTIFIHGKKDTLIPPKHSRKLYDACRAKQKALILRDEMTHNEFDFYDDLSVPVNTFMKKIGWTSFNKAQEQLILPAKLFEESQA